MLALLGASGAGLVASKLGPREAVAAMRPVGWLPACIVTPAQTEGPYFVDEKLNRIDIRPDPASGKVSEGAPAGWDLPAGWAAADDAS